MPIYEYVCDDCGFEKDIIQKMSEAPLKDCPSCDAVSFRKRISAGGFRLAGTGWYETDFKTGKKKNLVEKGSSSTPTESSAG
jgi:putative FmdB family regulatory protein